jgi:hypothetical protein
MMPEFSENRLLVIFTLLQFVRYMAAPLVPVVKLLPSIVMFDWLLRDIAGDAV